MTDYRMTLSTTKPNNDVGLIKIRQDDKATQIFDVTVTENDSPKSIVGYEPFFCLRLGDVVVDAKVQTVVDATKGRFKYQLDWHDWQYTGTAHAYFEFRQGDKAVFSTKDFTYKVIDNNKTAGIKQGNYLYNFEELMKSIEDMLGQNQATYLRELIQKLESSKASQQTLQEIYDTLNNNKADKKFINDYLSGITTIPEYVNSYKELKDKYPNGKVGLIVNTEDGKKYAWNNGMWESKGDYQAVALADSQIKTINNVNSYNNGNSYRIINSYTAFGDSRSGDDHLYIPETIYPQGFMSKISFKTEKNSRAKIYIFGIIKSDSNDSLKIKLIDRYEVDAALGENKVNVNKFYDYETLIGVVCDGISYRMDSSGSIFTNEYFTDDQIGKFYDITFTKSEIAIAIGANFKINHYERMINQLTNPSQPMMLDTSNPNYNKSYPIVFDFTQQKLKLSHGYILLFNGILDDTKYHYKNIGLELDLPPLTDTDDFNNYILLYNHKSDEFRLEHFVGYAKGAYSFFADEDILLAGVSVHETGALKPITYIGQTTTVDMVNVILSRASVESPSESSVEDVVNQRMINKGLYHYTYRALGDSITRGENPENDYKPMLGERYTDYVSKELGMLVYNHGIGGSTITTAYKGMCERVNELGNADVISVFGGTNDYGQGVKMGNLTDSDMTLFKPAFNKVISTLVNRADVQPFVITPLKREGGDNPNKAGLTLKDYVDAEIEIANSYGVPILNLWNEYAFTAAKSVNMKQKYMPDGLHPNPTGESKLAPKIASFIENLGLV